MKIEKLYYFLSVARHLNFTRAAQECHIAQPAISEQISSLEKELGVQLFERGARSIRLTAAGRISPALFRIMNRACARCAPRCRRKAW